MHAITQRDRYALARVNRFLNAKATSILYRAVLFSGSYRAANSSLVAISICRNLKRFSRTLIEVPSLANFVRSVTIDSTIHSDTKYALATQAQSTLKLISRIESVCYLGHWQEYWTLNSYLTIGGQPSTSTLKELILSTFGITKTHVLDILQLPQLRKLSVRSIISPSPPLTGADVQREQSDSS